MSKKLMSDQSLRNWDASNKQNDRLTTGGAILLIVGIAVMGVLSGFAVCLFRLMGWL